jgi:hypothetical protein
MKITVHKRKLVISAVISLLFLVTFVFVYVRFFRNELTEIRINNFFQICSDYGCNINDQESSKNLNVNILSAEEKNNSILLKLQIWNGNNNEIETLYLNIDSKYLTNNFLEGFELPKKAILKMHKKDLVVPVLYLSDYSDKILLTKESLTSIEFVYPEEEYKADNYTFDSVQLSSDIKDSLKITGDLSRLDYLPSVLFLYDDTLSEGHSDPNEYGQILLREIMGISQQDDNVQNNCKILKSYDPDLKCSNYYVNLRSPVIEQVLSYDISKYDIKDIVESSIINDTDYISGVRANSETWEKYYQSKNIVINREISSYINSFIEYLYYSGLSCEDERYEEDCRDVLNLYEYSKFLTLLSEGNLCSKISYLPLLSAVTNDQDLEKEVAYILDNYPFESECTISSGQKGFCSIDLEERFSCISFLKNSLDYYKDDKNTRETLYAIMEDTISSYLDKYQNRIGIWGYEDINLLTSGRADEDIYPVRFYDIKANYIFSEILKKYYEE